MWFEGVSVDVQWLMDFISSYLSTSPVYANQIIDAAKSLGVAEGSLRYAASKLGVKSTRGPDPIWYLPEQEAYLDQEICEANTRRREYFQRKALIERARAAQQMSREEAIGLGLCPRCKLNPAEEVGYCRRCTTHKDIEKYLRKHPKH